MSILDWDVDPLGICFEFYENFYLFLSISSHFSIHRHRFNKNSALSRWTGLIWRYVGTKLTYLRFSNIFKKTKCSQQTRFCPDLHLKPCFINIQNFSRTFYYSNPSLIANLFKSPQSINFLEINKLVMTALSSPHSC